MLASNGKVFQEPSASNISSKDVRQHRRKTQESEVLDTHSRGENKELNGL